MSSFNAKSSYSFADGFHADTMHNPIGSSFCLSSLPGEDERLARPGSSDKPKMILILPANNYSSPFPPKELVLITGVFAKNFHNNAIDYIHKDIIFEHHDSFCDS